MTNGATNGTKEYTSIMSKPNELDDLAKKFYATKEWKELRQIMLETRNTGRCRNCQVSFSFKKWCEPVIDHILPLKIFPEYGLEINNLQILCNGCNYAKASAIDGEAESVLHQRRNNRMRYLKATYNSLEVSYMNSPLTLESDAEVKAFIKDANKIRRHKKKRLCG
jgi:5-methylcytosine-specific restriction endonuclease McrA